MSVQQEPVGLSTNVAVARVLMFLQGGAYILLVALGYLAFFAFRGRVQQPDAGQTQGGAQFGGRAIAFSLVIVALGILIIFLALRIARFSYGAFVASIVLEGIITALALFRLIRETDLLRIILFTFPAITLVLLIIGLKTFSIRARSIESP